MDMLHFANLHTAPLLPHWPPGGISVSPMKPVWPSSYASAPIRNSVLTDGTNGIGKAANASLPFGATRLAKKTFRYRAAAIRTIRNS